MSRRFSLFLSVILVQLGLGALTLADAPKGHVGAYLRKANVPILYPQKNPNGTNVSFRLIEGLSKSDQEFTDHDNLAGTGWPLDSQGIDQLTSMQRMSVEGGDFLFDFIDTLYVRESRLHDKGDILGAPHDTQLAKFRTRVDYVTDTAKGLFRLSLPKQIELEFRNGTLQVMYEKAIREHLVQQARIALQARRGFESRMKVNVTFEGEGERYDGIGTINFGKKLEEFRTKLTENDKYLNLVRQSLEDELSGANKERHKRPGDVDAVDQMLKVFLGQLRVLPLYGVTSQAFTLTRLSVVDPADPRGEQREVVWELKEKNNQDWIEEKAPLKAALGWNSPEKRQNLVQLRFDKARASGLMSAYLEEAVRTGRPLPNGVEAMKEQGLVMLAVRPMPVRKGENLSDDEVEAVSSSPLNQFLNLFEKSLIKPERSYLVGLKTNGSDVVKIAPWVAKSSGLDLVLPLLAMEDKSDRGISVKMTTSLAATAGDLVAVNYSGGDAEELNRAEFIAANTPQALPFTEGVLPKIKQLLKRSLVADSLPVRQEKNEEVFEGGGIVGYQTFKSTGRDRHSFSGQEGVWTEYLIVTVQTPPQF
jgi:hypothetical protein